MRFWYANFLLLGQSLALLVSFILIVIHGRISIGEPNAIVLGSEIAGMVAIAIFATSNIIWYLRRVKQDKRDNNRLKTP